MSVESSRGWAAYMTGKDRQLGRYAAAFLVTLSLVSSPAVWAQSNLDLDRLNLDPNRPSGSPLDQPVSTTSDTASTSNSASSSAVGSRPYEPPTVSAGQVTGTPPEQRTLGKNSDELDVRNPRLKPPASPGEYETWLQSVTGRKLKRFGTDLLLPSNRDYAVPAMATIPSDYALNVGDVVSIAMTGSIEGSADFQIDRNGQINLPRIGTVHLVGVRYRDLKEWIAAAIGRQYRGFEVSVAIKELRGVRVYVTGFANNPGAYTVNSLSTLVNAVLAAGGPSAGGSFRSIKLYRNGAEVSDFDLYDLIRKGDKSRDPLLQNEDVLFIPPVGQQVAVIGSVNEEAIYEARPGETLEDVLHLAGGPTNLADGSRLILYRLRDRDTSWSRQLARSAAASEVAEAGDIVQILPEGSLTRPLERQATLVRIEGEVVRPGNYYVQPNATLGEVLEKAGGLTSRAYVYGTNLQRLSVRIQQRQSFDEAVRQLELSLSAAPLVEEQRDAQSRERFETAQNVVARLRAAQPDGRVVLPIAANSTSLPDSLRLENNDTIFVPPQPTTVGVFGAVYRPASFLLKDGAYKVRDYLEEAGGPIRAADKGQIFLIRANGSVIAKRHDALNKTVLPGDVIFVPVRARGSLFWQRLRDVSQLLFGAGLSTAAVVSLTR